MSHTTSTEYTQTVDAGGDTLRFANGGPRMTKLSVTYAEVL